MPTEKLIFDEKGYLQPDEAIEVDLEILENYFVKDRVKNNL